MNSSSLSPAAAADTAGLSHREFAVSGMTCAACAARVERVLGRQPGVAEASVNLATRRASVRFDPLRLGTAELTATVERAGYGFAPADPGRPPARVADELDEAEVAARRRWLVRLVVAVPLTVTVVVLTRVTDTARSGWWAVGLAVPVVFGAGFPFLRGAWRQVRSGHANMDVLIALGSLAAFGYSVREVLVPPAVHRAHDGWAHAHLDMAPLIVTFLLLGRWLEARAEHRAGRALRALADLGPSTARVLDGDDTSPRVVPVESVHPGDRFLVLPGDRVPVDGVVVSGLSAVDESMLTGEPLPIDKAPGTTVAAASHNVTGSFVARATAVGADTTFARIVALVERAQGSKAPVQRLADRVAAVFVPAVVAVAVLTVLGWTVTGQPGRGVLAGIAVLVVACPCSLGLATPVAIMVGTGRGAALGILINGGESLEQCHRLDTVVFDKTGTLTRGTPTVTGQWTAADAGTAVDVLGLVAAAEAGSEHPVGAALVAHGLASGATGRRATAFRSFAGHGVRAEVDGHDVVVGRAGFVSPVAPFRSTPDLTALVARAEEEGSTLVLAAVDGRLSAAFALADTVKPEARAAVAELRGLGLDVAVVSGDGSRPAHHVAHAVGITDVEADATPSDKLAAIERRRVGGARVAMVGDGVNDAAALAAADVGIAMGSGTAVAQHTAGVVLLSGGLDGVGRAIRLARATYTTILQNLGWAFGYNLAALPLAAVGRLTPAVAGLAMGLSSVCVVTNSLRLNRFERAGRPASIAGAGRRRAGVALAWAAPVVVLLALGLGRSLLPAQYADVSRRRPAGAGLEVSVDILDARAGSNTIHVYLLGDGGLVGLADLRVSGRLVQFSHLPPVTAAVSLDPAGRGHRRGVITMPAGYWLFEIDGTAEDGRTVRAAFNAEIPD